jgi:protein ImuB
LHILQGPERIEDGWWEGWALRDYFVAQDNTGVRYWLFRERYGQWRWFLHGVFG